MLPNETSSTEKGDGTGTHPADNESSRGCPGNRLWKDRTAHCGGVNVHSPYQNFETRGGVATQRLLEFCAAIAQLLNNGIVGYPSGSEVARQVRNTIIKLPEAAACSPLPYQSCPYDGAIRLNEDCLLYTSDAADE